MSVFVRAEMMFLCASNMSLQPLPMDGVTGDRRPFHFNQTSMRAVDQIDSSSDMSLCVHIVTHGGPLPPDPR